MVELHITKKQAEMIYSALLEDARAAEDAIQWDWPTEMVERVKAEVKEQRDLAELVKLLAGG